MPAVYSHSGKCRCSCSGVRLGAISYSYSSQTTAIKSGGDELGTQQIFGGAAAGAWKALAEAVV